MKPALSNHVAPVFEDLCRDWTRTTHGRAAQRFGGWWGNSRNDLRRAGQRTTEEIDDYKLPALRQAGYEIDEHPQVLLFSRGGYNGTLTQAAAENKRLRLVSAAELAS